MAKPACRDLPKFGHSYGLPGSRDNEGVAKRKYTKPLVLLVFINSYFY